MGQSRPLQEFLRFFKKTIDLSVNPAIIHFHVLERWPSGRRRSPAKGVWEKSHRGFESLSLRQNNAPVAQLDRVSGYEPEGQEFESLRARHFY